MQMFDGSHSVLGKGAYPEPPGCVLVACEDLRIVTQGHIEDFIRRPPGIAATTTVSKGSGTEKVQGSACKVTV